MTMKENQQVEKIKAKYTPHEPTKLDELKALDKKVKGGTLLLAYVIGIVGALVLGTGMCLAMKIVGDGMALGIVIGCVGIALISINYPLYKRILQSRKKKYSAQIMQLSDEILNK